MDTTCHATSVVTWHILYLKGVSPLDHLHLRVPSPRADVTSSLPYSQGRQPLGLTGLLSTWAWSITPHLGGKQHTKGPRPASLYPSILYWPGSGQTSWSSISSVAHTTTHPMGLLRVFGLVAEAKGPRQGNHPLPGGTDGLSYV